MLKSILTTTNLASWYYNNSTLCLTLRRRTRWRRSWDTRSRGLDLLPLLLSKTPPLSYCKGYPLILYIVNADVSYYMKGNQSSSSTLHGPISIPAIAITDLNVINSFFAFFSATPRFLFFLLPFAAFDVLKSTFAEISRKSYEISLRKSRTSKNLDRTSTRPLSPPHPGLSKPSIKGRTTRGRVGHKVEYL